MKNNLLTPFEAAVILNCSVNAVRTRARRGQLTVTRGPTGFHVLFDRDEVQAMALNPPKVGAGFRKGKPGRCTTRAQAAAMDAANAVTATTAATASA